jgi:hypothetical protein
MVIAAKVQHILAKKCGQCHVIHRASGTGYIHAVGVQRLTRDPDGRYLLMTFDTSRLPRGVSADNLRAAQVVQTVERFLGRPVRLLGDKTVTYIVQVCSASQPLPVPEPRAA